MIFLSLFFCLYNLQDWAVWLETVTVTLNGPKDEAEADRSEVNRSEGLEEGSEFMMDEESPVVMRRPKQVHN